MSDKSGIEIDIKEIDEINKKFDKMEQHLNKALPVITKRALTVVKEEAQDRSPLGKTKLLRMSFWVKLDSDGRDGKVGSNVAYLPALEFGSGLYGEKHARYLIRNSITSF